MSMLHRTFLIIFTIVVFWTLGTTQALAKVTSDKVGGQKVPPNLSVDQLKDAAHAGDPDAQYALGYMYYYGKGISQDVDTANAWIGKAAAQGQPQAIKAMALIQQVSDPQAAEIHTSGLANSAAHSNHSDAPPASTTVKNTDLGAMPQTGGIPQYNTPVSQDTVIKQSSTPSGTNQVPAQSVSTPPAAAPSAPATTPTPSTMNATPVAAPVSASNAVPATAAASLNQQALLSAPKNYFTIQLLGASRKSDVETYLNKNSLQDKATYYRTVRNGNDWYVVVYGLYPSRPEAQAALKTLPTHIQQQGPWVNSLSKVQDSIQKKA